MNTIPDITPGEFKLWLALFIAVIIAFICGKPEE